MSQRATPSQGYPGHVLDRECTSAQPQPPHPHPPHPQEPCCARASCQASSWSSLPPGESYRVTCMRP